MVVKKSFFLFFRGLSLGILGGIGLFLGSCSSSSKHLAPVVFKGDKPKKGFSSSHSPFIETEAGTFQEEPILEEIDVTPAFVPSPSVSFLHHIVKPGETLITIANLYKIELPSLLQENQLRPPYTLTVGQKLRIPQGLMSPSSLPEKVETRESTNKFTPSFSPHRVPGPSFLAPPPSASSLLPLRSPEKELPSEPSPQESFSKESSERMLSPSLLEEEKISENLPPVEQASQPAPAAAPLESPSVPESSPSSSSVSESEKIFSLPVSGEIIMGFGVQANGSQNDGINITAPQGASIRTTAPGTVTYAGNELHGFGNLVLIKHDNGWMSAYGHLDKILVKRGQDLKKGQQIGTVGKTGSVTSPQLHFELRHGGICVNPENYIKSS